MLKNSLACTLILFLLANCSPAKRATTADTSISAIKLVSEFDVPFKLSYKNTTVGGLSGIDYNPAKNEYYLICDDRSSINPARFYTAKIIINQNKIDSVQFTGITSLLQKSGQVYPNTKLNPAATPDPEALRLHAKTGTFVWTSEGERIVNKQRTVLANPAITMIDKGGRYIDTFPIPAIFTMKAETKGPRQNGVFEGLAFEGDSTMYVSVEEPLYEDGPRADLQPNQALIRIIKYDVYAKQPVAQFAYRLDPVAYQANPADSFKINGMPDILSIGKNKLLVVERSFSTGRRACTIKVFVVDVSKAEDVSANSSMINNPPAKPLQKQLLLNMDSLGIYIDNVEGVTFGPVLPNGHQSLIFVSDNNFSEKEKTQFLLFEVIP